MTLIIIISLFILWTAFAVVATRKYDAVQRRDKESPYQHVLNRQGTACAEYCDACQWAADRRMKHAEDAWLEKLYALEDTRDA